MSLGHPYPHQEDLLVAPVRFPYESQLDWCQVGSNLLHPLFASKGSVLVSLPMTKTNRGGCAILASPTKMQKLAEPHSQNQEQPITTINNPTKSLSRFDLAENLQSE